MSVRAKVVLAVNANAFDVLLDGSIVVELGSISEAESVARRINNALDDAEIKAYADGTKAGYDSGYNEGYEDGLDEQND